MNKEPLRQEGKLMWQLIERLWPICRSITGNGLRETLNIIKEHIPVEISEVPSGTKVLDWTVPREWNINDAYILDESGKKIIDFRENNLHVVGYSVPVNEWLELDELQKHLHSLEKQPDAIPYVTSYYREYWGFCLSHKLRASLKPGKYFVHIDSAHTNGSLTYGEYIIKGASEKEIFLSAYVCHPSMASNELSGPVVLTMLAKWLASEKRKYTYRIVFIPETIGSLTYLSKHYKELKEKVIAGFNISCVGDNNNYSYVQSRYGNTFADKMIRRVLDSDYPGYKKFSFLERGSDERQYCSPGIDLPLVVVCRTKYEEYPEYHTSLDNLSYICEEGLTGALELLRKVILLIEEGRYYRIKTLGEPQLGKRNLYPVLSTKTSVASVKRMMNFIAYADGRNDIEEISKITGIPTEEILSYAELLKKEGLLEETGIIQVE
jgi:aminopeptidase-like protein